MLYSVSRRHFAKSSPNPKINVLKWKSGFGRFQLPTFFQVEAVSLVHPHPGVLLLCVLGLLIQCDGIRQHEVCAVRVQAPFLLASLQQPFGSNNSIIVVILHLMITVYPIMGFPAILVLFDTTVHVPHATINNCLPHSGCLVRRSTPESIEQQLVATLKQKSVELYTSRTLPFAYSDRSYIMHS